MFLTKTSSSLQRYIEKTALEAFAFYLHNHERGIMAHFTRTRNLVRLFAQARNGEERLIAAVKVDSHRARQGLGIRLYDYGHGVSYIRYTVGCRGPQGRWLSENAADVVQAFREAGIMPPPIRGRRIIGRFIAPFFRNAPQANEAPAQRIG